jgi:hypothetical protein
MAFRVLTGRGRDVGVAWLWLAAALLTGSACRGHGAAKPADDLSAEEHRRLAEREHAASATHASQFNPQAARPTPFRNPIDSTSDRVFTSEIYNPTDRHLQAAEKHHRHARQHETAAQKLEQFEEQECRSFPPASRAACPFLGPATDVRDIDKGISVRMADGVRVDAVVAHMKCHAAYAQARGYPPDTTCPIYVPGVSIRQGANPREIELTVADPSLVTKLRQRARDEVVPAGVSLRTTKR